MSHSFCWETRALCFWRCMMAMAKINLFVSYGSNGSCCNVS
ncbi:hypothetical protein NC652_040238 [Populus alba x Populus x berolinensis]|uniref:Uncharacterized protein n=1 Tax=Populus alba x Populus x berolinensis TaxID=444605 RepID=A0AAD6PRL1_9ROSI|nr:hypothetical protein NC652_040238 [Populus alba x Populus x berolinensis]KAJ6958555.1 hypothetical protein NC653_040266 [Populus alba x Populus x berolinensis]